MEQANENPGERRVGDAQSGREEEKRMKALAVLHSQQSDEPAERGQSERRESSVQYRGTSSTPACVIRLAMSFSSSSIFPPMSSTARNQTVIRVCACSDLLGFQETLYITLRIVLVVTSHSQFPSCFLHNLISFQSDTTKIFYIYLRVTDLFVKNLPSPLLD